MAWIRGAGSRSARTISTSTTISACSGGARCYGHGIWLGEDELARCHETGTAIAHCPTSNAFLGSGAFDLRRGQGPRRPVAVGLATDLGAGTSFSMLATMGAAYAAAQRNGRALSAAEAFYLATRGAARALDLDDRSACRGGMEADLVVSTCTRPS